VETVPDASHCFGTPTSGLVSGDYVVCWAYDPQSLADFKVEIDRSGKLVGPESEEFVCTLGLGCSVALSGYELAATSSVALVDGPCGEGSIVSLGDADYTHDSLSAVLRHALYGSALPTEPTADFPFCGPDSDGAYLCSADELDLYYYYSYFGCMGDPQAYFDLTCPKKCGYCGTTLSHDGVYAFGAPLAGVPRHDYSLCWAHDGSTASDFKVTLDFSAELCGPDLADFVCTLGLPCAFTTTGFGLQPSNGIVVLSAGSCGDGAVAEGAGRLNFPEMDYAEWRWENSYDPIGYDFGRPLRMDKTDVFTLCWGHSPSSLADFNVQIDAAELIGPFLTDLHCTLGMPCDVTVDGYGLQDSNSIVVLTKASAPRARRCRGRRGAKRRPSG
jgi:hypothetical protein